MQEKYYPVKAKTLSDTITYLSSRPYREVAHFINELAKDIGEQNAKDKASGVHQEQRESHSQSYAPSTQDVSECPA